MQYLIPCRLEYDSYVTVEADSPADALDRFKAINWVKEHDNQQSLVNWEATGKPQIDE